VIGWFLLEVPKFEIPTRVPNGGGQAQGRNGGANLPKMGCQEAGPDGGMIIGWYVGGRYCRPTNTRLEPAHYEGKIQRFRPIDDRNFI